MRKVFAAGLALGLTFGASWADTAPVPPTAAQIATAKELMEASGAAQTLLPTQNLEAALVQARKMAPGLDDKTLAKLRQIVTEEFNAARPGLLEDAAKIYAAHLSEADMRALIAFYHSETGQHLVAATPGIMSEATPLITPIMQHIMKRVMMELVSTSDDKAGSKKK
ncbi:MAG: DUF2059 domain-containing protein [Rhizomicrobium sp.]